MRLRVQFGTDNKWHITEEPETDSSMRIVTAIDPRERLREAMWVCEFIEDPVMMLVGPFFFRKLGDSFPNNELLSNETSRYYDGE